MKNLSRLLQTTYRLTRSNFRWLGFILAFVSILILSSTNVDLQWIGWSLASTGTLIWIYASHQDKDLPRKCMEVMYLLLSLYAAYNWFNYG